MCVENEIFYETSYYIVFSGCATSLLLNSLIRTGNGTLCMNHTETGPPVANGPKHHSCCPDTAELSRVQWHDPHSATLDNCLKTTKFSAEYVLCC